MGRGDEQEPDGVTPSGDAVPSPGREGGGHDLLVAVAELTAAAQRVLVASGRTWSLSDEQVRGAVEAVARASAVQEAARLAVVKVLDDRPDAVPGAAAGKVAASFLIGRLRSDFATAAKDVRTARALDADTGTLPHLGAALAAGEITREHADVCVRAVARLPKRLTRVLVEHEPTGDTVTGLELADRWLTEQAKAHGVRAVKQLADELVRRLDPDRADPFDVDAHTRRSATLHRDDAGGVLRVQLTPADAALVAVLLDALGKPHRPKPVTDTPTGTPTDNDTQSAAPADAASDATGEASDHRPGHVTNGAALDEDGAEQPVLVRDDRTPAMRRYDGLMNLLRYALNPHPADATGSGSGSGGPYAPFPDVRLHLTASLEQLAAAATAAAAAAAAAAGPAAGRGTGPDPDPPADLPSQPPPAAPGDGPTTGRARQEQPVPVPDAFLRAAGQATLTRYGPLSPLLLDYLTCTATVTRILLDSTGSPLHVGRTHRLATPAQRTALAIRDAGCTIPGCPVPHHGTDAHHTTPWAAGGPTDLDHLALLCPTHHQHVHAGIWQITVINGHTYVRPPAWIDPHRRWTRNTLHTTPRHTTPIAQQLRLALDTDAATTRRTHRTSDTGRTEGTGTPTTPWTSPAAQPPVLPPGSPPAAPPATPPARRTDGRAPWTGPTAPPAAPTDEPLGDPEPSPPFWQDPFWQNDSWDDDTS